MAEKNGYIGRSPGDSAVTIASQTFEPTGIQTNFTFSSGYVVGYLDVYVNGVKLIFATDYTATDGSTVGLTTFANSGDIIECIAYKAFNLGNVESAGGNFTVGGDLTVSGDTTLSGNLNVTGVTTLGAGTSVSFATTSFGLSGDATSTGPLTISDTTESSSASTGALVVSGGVGIAKSLTVDGNITCGGTITYEDMTNTDVIGFGTFRKGIEVQGAGSTTTTLNVTGVSTLSGETIVGSGVTINSTGIEVTSGIITAGTCFKAGGGMWGPGIGATILGSGNVVFAGITSVGSAITMYASAGIVSATSFYGDGSNLEGVAASGSSLDITSCLFI